MDGSSLFFFFFFLLFCFFNCIQYSSSDHVVRQRDIDDGLAIVSCQGTEREALVEFRRHLNDPNHLLSPWSGKDCCRWEGVECNNQTGHVVRLDLSGRNDLGGEITPSLLTLKQLAYLDLSQNTLSWDSIPNFMGSFERLTYLNLSGSGFTGRVPHQLGNLTLLTHLDLSGDYGNLEVHDAGWISDLSSLQVLDMSGVNFTTSSIIQSLNVLPSLRELKLQGCSFASSIPVSLHHVNFAKLASLDLSSNRFNSTLPIWLFRVTSLEYLHLSGNAFSGSISDEIGNLTRLRWLDLSDNNLGGGQLPESLGELTSLTHLDLSQNSLPGPLPASIGRLSSLQHLDVSQNNFNGDIPVSIGGLSNLIELDLYANSLKGVLTEAHFTNLTSLKHLDITFNPSLALNVSPDWDPPFRLEYISMKDCSLGPRFPQWLRTQENYSTLRMSNTSISDTIPEWFWNLSSNVDVLDLSGNAICGLLQFDAFNGTGSIDLSDNCFYGPIPPNIGDGDSLLKSSLYYFSVSTNNLNGTIPPSICNLTELALLRLSKNHFSGQVPDCWDSSSQLEVLDASSNNLTGQIPGSLCLSEATLKILSLSNNNLSGDIPSLLSTCQGILVLDVAHNMLSGRLPKWLGETLPEMQILLLQSNGFSGNIPLQLSNLSAVRILDLSWNNLSGVIPTSFGNFTNMIDLPQLSILEDVGILLYEPIELWLNTKGRELAYGASLIGSVSIMDLSHNRLSGGVPVELGNLVRLQSLDLSGNLLTGRIPQELGALKELETLDLSRNELSGDIPSSLSELHFLARLNLSYNDLSGRIPSGSQLQTFGQSSFVGNSRLCGLPLAKNCQDDEDHRGQMAASGKEHNGDDEQNEILWLYAGLSSGFVVGICVVCGTLVFKRSWRVAYFKFTDDMTISIRRWYNK